MIPELLEQIKQTRVLVVGDIMLDRYWYGKVERISPEAPVPVISIDKNDERPGGAANVARNVAALDAKCTLIAVGGDDPEAGTLQDLVEQAGVKSHIVRDSSAKTTVKLRVISRNQQLIRIDFEAPVTDEHCAQLLDQYLQLLPETDVVILSDYGKGGLEHIQKMVAAASGAQVPVVIDPKGSNYAPYKGATLITPNRKEFELVAGIFRTNEELVKKANKLIAELEISDLLITRGEEGMSLITKKGEVLHYPARAREVYDVTGAGDTVIAAVGAGYATGSPPEDVLHLANVAAGIVVGKLGAATANPDEIRQVFAIEEK